LDIRVDIHVPKDDFARTLRAFDSCVMR
jgi:hypothetical protein